MRNRLVAFGCSNTYGHGLSDCINKDRSPGPYPSKYAWPSVLSEKLSRECVNYGIPGASNKEIWEYITRVKLSPRDIVVVLWTYHERWATLNEELPHNGIYAMQKSKAARSFYKHLYSDYDMMIDLNLRIHHASMFLDSLGITNYHAVMHKDELKKAHWNTAPVYYSEFENYRFSMPKAKDRQHPGPNAHAKFAEDLYNLMRTK